VSARGADETDGADADFVVHRRVNRFGWDG
jgi:hypothetical protein